METKAVTRPSFPEAPANSPLPVQPNTVFQVHCGDEGHWRTGSYSPKEASAAECQRLELHSCPELFVLLSGRLTLLLAEKEGVRELPLPLHCPVLVTAPHNGFCPDGPHTGVALVVERDTFVSQYQKPHEWVQQLSAEGA
jgi:hypothetical protein